MKNQKILVTGGCGYIGSHVSRQLCAQGARVFVLDNLSTGFRDSLLSGETLIEGDTGNAALVARVLKEQEIDAVLHFAAAIVVPESVANPVKYYRNNTLNTLNLLAACAEHGVKKFIFSSTAAVYGEPKQNPVTESAPTLPMSPYGHSKLMSEQMMRDVAAAHDLRYVVLRYFNVAGASPDGKIGQRTPNATHLIKVACEVATGKRKDMTVYGQDYPTVDGTCVRDYIHVEDLADAHVRALAYLNEGGKSETLNCGYGHGSSVLEVIRTLKEESGIDFRVNHGPRRPGDVAEIVARAERIQTVLGWKPRYDDLRAIVRHAYQWERHLTAL